MSASREFVIHNPSGLHARPAARLVEQAKRFDSTLTIEMDGKAANAKSLISLMKLGISTGATVTLRAEGSDEDTALEVLCVLLNELEGEESA